MKILWFSDLPWTSTGYGVQTKLIVPRLKALGHDVAMASKYGLQGGFLKWGGCQIYPSGRARFSLDVLGSHAHHFGADLLITLCDIWACEPRAYGGARWVPYFPIDSEPFPKAGVDRLRSATQPIVFSKFGVEMARQGGVDVLYVPLCVDTTVYEPKDGARERLGWPTDRFIVGMVADNKDEHDRKAFVEQLSAFARFSAGRSDALLYLHTNSGVDGRGLDLVALCDALGLVEGQNLRWVDQYLNVLGVPETQMVDVYNGLDVLLAVSAAEGFGVPLIEAQACGTPVIAGDWTSMAELSRAGWQVASADTAPRLHPIRGLMRVPRVEAIVDALEQAYRDATKRRGVVREAVAEYDADRVALERWSPVLTELAARVASGPRTFAEALAR